MGSVKPPSKSADLTGSSVDRENLILMIFKDLGLQSFLLDRCESLGFTEPTPIQKQAIPFVLKCGDVIATAETVTGKTAAFLLPILQRIDAVQT